MKIFDTVYLIFCVDGKWYPIQRFVTHNARETLDKDLEKYMGEMNQ